MKNSSSGMRFTITRQNQNGLIEWLTCVGFRSAFAIQENDLQKLWFSRIDGYARIRLLRRDCRIPALSRSIILNFS